MTDWDESQEAPPLHWEDRQALVEALTRWAERHPDPDKPVFGYTDTEFVSPRELVRAVRDKKPLGERFVRDVRLATMEMPFSVYLEAIERSRAAWWEIVWSRLTRPFRRLPRQMFSRRWR
jgi:hypothetical protein